jgi:hypothetical protein
MLPDTHDRPAGGPQCRVVSSIALPGASELSFPPSTISLWELTVLRTAMPEASINEHCNASPGEDKVCLATKAWHWRQVLSIT